MEVIAEAIEPLYVTRPLLPDMARVTEKLKTVWASQVLSNGGEQHLLLEQQLKAFLNVPELSLFNNGTTALMVGLRALGLQGEVITTPFSFPASTHVLSWSGITPVFCDIDPVSLTLDAAKVEALITPRTTGILGVHVYGNPCQCDALASIANQNGLRILYDAAHAFGTEVNGRSIAEYGDLTMFSFHATKLFHCAEGGALVCHNPELKARIDLMKNFGIRNEFDVVMPGINGKMNELQAVMGQLVLEMVRDEQAKRKHLRQQYTAYLQGVDGIRLRAVPNNTRDCQQYLVVEIDESLFGASRDAVFLTLRRHNIHARKYFYPLISDYPCYRDLPSASPAALPMARLMASRLLCLPFYGDLAETSVARICELIQSCQQGRVNGGR